MNYDQTLEQMRSLRLHGMAQALDSLIAAKKVSTINAEQLLAMLVQHEYDDRSGRKIDRLKKAAKFRYNAALDCLFRAKFTTVPLQSLPFIPRQRLPVAA